MTTYNELAGLKVSYVDSDPTLNSGNEGQVWYNSTSGTLKALVQLKAWSSTGNLPAIRSGSGGAGIQTAALNIAGENGASLFATSEEYSGYTWAAGGTMAQTPSAIRFLNAGTGTQTAALSIGGQTDPVGSVPVNWVEGYDGTTWTTKANLPAATGGIAASGTQTSALAFGGQTPTIVATTSTFNGTSWSPVSSMNTARSRLAGFGTQTAALAAGGNAGPGAPNSNATELWNGTTWTTVNSLNNGKTNLRGWGSSVNGAVAGGRVSTAAVTQTELWDGTSWTSSVSLGTAGYLQGTAGGPGSPSGLFAGGGRAPSLNASAATEEFNSTIFSPATGVWASGGNLSTARGAGASAGTQTEALYAGGNTGTYVATTEEYNGTSWGPGGNLNTARGYTAGAGSQTSAVVFGGFTPSSPTFATSATEEYDGSAWASNPTGLGTARYGLAGCGTQTAALAFGGQVSPGNQTEEYDGSAWTSGGNLNTGRKYLAGCGTQTAGLAVGGNPSSPTVTGATEEYDGSAWTSNPTGLNSSRGSGLGVAGTITNAVAFGGLLTAPAPGTGTTATELYDGSNWVSAPPMTTGRYFIGNAGSASSGLAFGGRNAPARNANTEEWSGPQTTATASTLTTS